MNALILCIGVAGILAIVFGLIVLLRYLGYRETITLAEKGLTPPEKKKKFMMMLQMKALAIDLIIMHFIPNTQFLAQIVLKS